MVSIVIVNHNGKKWLKDCLDSITRQSYRSFEIVVVDNASTDDSVGYIRKYYPDVKIVISKTNIGFGRANNLCVRSTRGDIIFFLNNDTVLERDLLEKLLRNREKNKFNITGPKIIDYGGKEIHGRYKMTIDPTGYLGSGEKTFFIDGCALMIGKKDFLYLGGFDEKYFMYCEDVDLCWRAHLYNMKIEVCEDAIVKHFGGGTGGYTQFDKNVRRVIPLVRRYEVEKNNLRNLLKNYGFINLLWVIPLFLLQSLGECLVYLITGNLEAGKAVLKAHLWNLVNFGDTLNERKIVQKKRIIGDRQIISMMSFGLNKFSALRTIGIPKFR